MSVMRRLISNALANLIEIYSKETIRIYKALNIFIHVLVEFLLLTFCFLNAIYSIVYVRNSFWSIFPLERRYKLTENDIQRWIIAFITNRNISVNVIGGTENMRIFTSFYWCIWQLTIDEIGTKGRKETIIAVLYL